MTGPAQSDDAVPRAPKPGSDEAGALAGEGGAVALPVVTVTPTIMSGPVVRWHWNLHAAMGGAAVLSASRDGAMIHGDVFVSGPDAIPQEWVDAARAAHATLAAGGSVTHLATHRTRGLRAPLEPAEPKDIQP